MSRKRKDYELTGVSTDSTPGETMQIQASDGAFRKVEHLSNLANACKNKELLKILQDMPDGQMIFNIFLEAIQKRIDVVMIGGIVEDVGDAGDDLVRSITSCSIVASELNDFMVAVKNSPLLQTLDLLSKNLANTARATGGYNNQAGQFNPVNPQGFQPNGYPNPQQGQVTADFHNQREQTPMFTERSKKDPTAADRIPPTVPPRGYSF